MWAAGAQNLGLAPARRALGQRWSWEVPAGALGEPGISPRSPPGMCSLGEERLAPAAGSGSLRSPGTGQSTEGV